MSNVDKKTEIRMDESCKIREYIPGTNIKLPEINEWDIQKLMDFFANRWNKKYKLSIIAYSADGLRLDIFDNKKETDLLFDSYSDINKYEKRIIVSVIDTKLIPENCKDTILDIRLIIGFEDEDPSGIIANKFTPLCYKNICIDRCEYDDKIIVFIPITPIFKSDIYLARTENSDWNNIGLLNFLVDRSRNFFMDSKCLTMMSQTNDDDILNIKRDKDGSFHSNVSILNVNIGIVSMPYCASEIGGIELIHNEDDLILSHTVRKDWTGRKNTVLIIPIEPLCKSKNIMVI